ncbi:MAG: hypothetical protein AAGI01_06210 [Myxococcota bacterium]
MNYSKSLAYAASALLVSLMAIGCVRPDLVGGEVIFEDAPPAQTFEVPEALEPPKPWVEGECSTGPRVTYANFGQGFLTARCQSCHGSQTTNRYGAPLGVSFDTLEQVTAFRERILARSTCEARTITMPPGNGMTPDEPRLLKQWLECSGEF